MLLEPFISSLLLTGQGSVSEYYNVRKVHANIQHRNTGYSRSLDTLGCFVALELSCEYIFIEFLYNLNLNYRCITVSNKLNSTLVSKNRACPVGNSM